MEKYANARDVLPKELFEELKKHYTGLLYVSGRTHPRDNRKLALMLYDQKTETKDIASITGLSVRRVNQIIEQERLKNEFKCRAEGKMPPAGHNARKRAARRSRVIVTALASVWEKNDEKNERTQKPESDTESQ